MKTLLTFAGSALIALSVMADASATAVSKAKAIELAAHRVDRLVTLKKIDATFTTKMEKLEVSVVENQAPVHYKVRVSQTKPVKGNPLQVDLSFDINGKPLAFQLIAGGVAGADMGWSGKSAGELVESALHYVLENATAGKVSLFDKDATSLTLSKASLKEKTVAQAELLASSTTEKLNIKVSLDGTFVSAEVVP